MNIVRFNNGAVNRNLVDELFRSFLVNDTREQNNRCVPANVIDNEKDFRIELSIPGFSRDDVKISFQNNTLTVKSDKKSNEEDGSRFIRRGFVPQNFEKHYRLSKEIDTDNIAAAFNNGILEITLPKKVEVPGESAVEIAIQ
jgi:HSP20 family protein